MISLVIIFYFQREDSASKEVGKGVGLLQGYNEKRAGLSEGVPVGVLQLSGVVGVLQGQGIQRRLKYDPDVLRRGRVLDKEGLLDVRCVALLLCGVTWLYMEKHLGILEEGWRAIGHRRWFSEAEFLYGELMRYLGEHPELESRIRRFNF